MMPVQRARMLRAGEKQVFFIFLLTRFFLGAIIQNNFIQ